MLCHLFHTAWCVRAQNLLKGARIVDPVQCETTVHASALGREPHMSQEKTLTHYHVHIYDRHGPAQRWYTNPADPSTQRRYMVYIQLSD